MLAAIAVFEFAPGVRKLALPRSGETATASNEDTVSVPAGVPIGGPFQLTDATTAMMHDMTGMMWGTGLVWLIVIVVLVLAIAALVKYVFFR